jgi:DegV family protein with EDD domain
MSKVGIITDSIHGLPTELVKRYDIRVAHMSIVINNKGYRDMIDITPAQIYPIIREAREPWTTNAVMPGQFLEIYESLSKGSDSLLYIGVSRALTATFNIAQQAKDIFLEDHPGVSIEFIDSKNCMGALGFLLLEAARASEAGKGLAEIIDLVNRMVPRVKYLSVLDTMKYLLKIGRIPKSAVSEERLNFRPMIGMTDNSGTMQNFAPVESAQAMEKLVEMAAKFLEPGSPVHAIINFSDYVEEAQTLKRLVTTRLKPVEFYMSEYSPAALVSTGLMTGVSFYS